MRPTSLLRVSLVAAAFLGSANRAVVAQASGPYRITGTVVNRIDGSPIPHCHLTATLITGGGMRRLPSTAPQNGFDTDEQGRFNISLPSPGWWSLRASARGFVSQFYDAHQQYSSAIVMTPEAQTINLRFALAPEAVVTGRVLDEAGEPVRNAHLSLLLAPAAEPDARPSPVVTQGNTQTDDRGMYEFANVAPGDYRVMLQAQPWYVSSAQPRRSAPSDSPQLDPSLDVTYPLLWFPGVDDPAVAEVITLHGGDTRQADFHLVPIPSIHLKILPPPTVSSANGRPISAFPIVERVIRGGTGTSFLPVSVNFNQQSQIDVGGLSPGLYQIRLQGQGPDNKTSFVEVTNGSTRIIDLGASPSVANVTVHLDGVPDAEESAIQVNLFDVDTGQQFSTSTRGVAGSLRRRQQTPHPERVFQVPPGRYEVTLSGRPDIYLAGITAQPAEVTGRILRVQSGEITMTAHVAAGHATLAGVATLMSKPLAGAMVLLVPASLGDPAAIPVLRRAQTNTDGSFEFPAVIPGQYILVAIDNGWHVNWKDPSTLRNYLMHGVPVELSASANTKQEIEAQSP